MLDDITPVLLTYNEEQNIGRSLERLRWAKDIVVVDSLSTDRTVDILREFEYVRLFNRRFDSHANQWNYALTETGVKTPWVLVLDADYLLTDAFLGELKDLRPSDQISGYRARFQYCVLGRALRGALYPSVVILFKTQRGSYIQDGHTQRVAVDGVIGELKNVIMHDDRKSLSRWLQSQDRYMKLEADVLTKKSWQQLNWPDRIRKTYVVAPFAVFIYCLFLKKGIFDGRAGLFYALQRMLAEVILSLHLLQNLYGSAE